MSVLQLGDVEAVAAEGLQERHLRLWTYSRLQQVADLSHHGRGHKEGTV
jgi:hypothetical protein